MRTLLNEKVGRAHENAAVTGLFLTSRTSVASHARPLEQVAAWRDYPTRLRLDNGPEFVALALAEWAADKGTTLGFIEFGQCRTASSNVSTASSAAAYSTCIYSAT